MVLLCTATDRFMPSRLRMVCCPSTYHCSSAGFSSAISVQQIMIMMVVPVTAYPCPHILWWLIKLLTLASSSCES